MILPSNRRSVCWYSQICTFCRLCKNRNIRFCKSHRVWVSCSSFQGYVNGASPGLLLSETASR